MALAIFLTVYCVSIIHVLHESYSESENHADNRKIVRIAHNLTDNRINLALYKLAREYEWFHPDIRIVFQAIPERAYEQWVTTQMMGGNAPDLVQVLARDGLWSNLSQQYLTPLSSIVVERNLYNAGTDLENVSWRDTYVDSMEGGYFYHLMEYYSIPLSLNNHRIFYNKDLWIKITGNDAPPESYSDWKAVCHKIITYDSTLVPMAVSQEDDLFNRYFPTMTGGMMDNMEPQFWGIPKAVLTLYGLYTGSLDLHDDRIKAGFTLLREMAGFFQLGFISDQPEQKRFLFLQGKAVMVVGDTRDLGLYDDAADFEVGVFKFPQVGYDDPHYGKYYAGPALEDALSTFSFGLSRNSKYPESALDFLKFCTSRKKNEQLCRLLTWYPAISGSRVKEKLNVFAPDTEGVISYPEMVLGSGATQLYFEQYYTAYLSGEISYDTFMTGLRDVWLTRAPDDIERRIKNWIRNNRLTEYNISKAKVKLLFAEAGDLEAGEIMGKRTAYELGLEVIELLDRGNVTRRYILEHLQRGNYKYPPIVSESKQR